MEKLTTFRRIALMGITIALAVGLGFALAGIPNVELVTLTLAFCGFLLGPLWGGITGACAWCIYSALSPYGMAPPPLLAAQILGGFGIGLFGGLFRLMIYFRINSKIGQISSSAVLGLICSLWYQVLANTGAFFAFTSTETLWAFVIGGIAFSLVNIGFNVAAFAVLFPVLARVAKVRH